jgi:DNA polymerase (family 10)
LDKVITCAFREAIKLAPFATKLEIAGSIRRKKSDPRDVDIVLIPKGKNMKGAIIFYASAHEKGKIGQGENLASYNVDGVEVDIYFATSKNWGAMLLYLTGPQKYNIGLRMVAKKKGLLLNQYGLWKVITRCVLGKKGEELPVDNVKILVASKTEEDIYRALGKEWKAPELRGK